MLLERINQLCSERCLSISELERRLEISHGLIRKWKTVKPSADNILKISHYFNVSTDYLLGNSENRKRIDDVSESEEIDIRTIHRAYRQMSSEEQERMKKILHLTFQIEFNEEV